MVKTMADRFVSMLAVAVCALVALADATAPVRTPTPFAAGERVTFYGDSITTHNYFTYQLEFILALRHPERPMLTISRGRAGGTAQGGFMRWDWDAAPVPSDRVVVMFGMNDVSRGLWKEANPDAALTARREKALATYAEFQRKLTEKILATGRKVLLVTPSPYDQYSPAEPPENLPFCNDPGLATCAKIVRDLAREKNLEVLDYHAALTKFLKEHPEFGLLAKDRIHPDEKGGLLMAVIALEQAGDLAYSDETSFDAKGMDHAAFDYLPRHLPYPRQTREYQAVNAVYPLDGRLSREIVRITGLPAGRYRLAGDGKSIGVFTAEALATGIDLACHETPSMAQAKSAAAAFNERRSHMQTSRRLVGIEFEIRAKGVDPADRAAADAAIEKFRAGIERRLGGGKNPRLHGYYLGQADFYCSNRDKKAAFDAENERLYRQLVQRCRPRGWKLSVEPTK